MIPVGKMVLNENPKDYFSEVEQAAFSPNNLIPGIEPSPDKVLQVCLLPAPDVLSYNKKYFYEKNIARII